jgi:formate hydrogenlyase transcriptional activator
VAIETESERRARERANLVAALERSGGKVYGSGGAAELLGVPSTTLASRLRALGIRRF